MKSIRRRRRQAKTDYQLRLALLKSEKPRIVIRKTNKHIVIQIVASESSQDKVLFSLTSKELLAVGWPKEKSGSLKSIPAAYLTGLLFGSKLDGKMKKEKFILDIGLQRNIHKSRIYSALKGLIDAGIDISHSKEALPTNEELKKQENLAFLIEKLKGAINK